jgi:hypothetical protein
VLVLVGDDWAEGHHDVELMDHSGRALARARLAEGPAGMARLHAVIGEHLSAQTMTRLRYGWVLRPARGRG